jgi:serine protease Do
MHLIAGYKPGIVTQVKLLRDGREKMVNVTLGERPEKDAPVLALSGQTENRLGFEVHNLTEDLARRYDINAETAVVVIQVEEGSLAEKEGIQTGDIVREVNRQAVRNVREFNRIVGEVKSGDTVLLRLVRGENKFFVALKVEND